MDGTTTLTSYIGSVEEVQISGSSTQTTTYYAVGGKRVAADVNGTFYSFGYDALGSQVAVLNATGSLIGAQLYGPYGSSRYNTGTIQTSIGFTGQRADSVTGLDYYVARYYDPGVGQFLSVDRVQGNAQGTDPYAYVGGNPESRTDPTGHRDWGGCDGGEGTGGGGGVTPGAPTPGGDGGGSTTQPTPTPTPTPNNHKQQSSQGDNTAKSGGTAVKDWVRLGFGAGKIISGLGLVVLSFLNFTNPVMAVLETLARFVLKNALVGIVWMINDGIRDVLASFTYVNPVIRVWTDIAAIALDIIAVISSAVSILSFVKAMSMVRTLAGGMKNLIETAQDFAAARGSVKAIGSLRTSQLNALGGAVGLGFLGVSQFISDVNNLRDDWATLPN